ncbi:MAG: phage tail tape measure protein [Fusobacteriaceae bacterium]
MASKYMDLVMKLSARVDKQLPTSLRNVSKEMSLLNKQQKEIKASQKAGDNHNNLKKKLGENIALYRANRNELRMLKEAKDSGLSLTKKEEARYSSLSKSVNNLNKKMGDQKNAYRSSKMELQKLKIPLDKLDGQYKKNTKSLVILNRQLAVNSRMSKIKSAVGGAVGGAVKKVGKVAAVGAVAGTIALSYGAVQSAKAYSDFNGQMKRVQAISNASTEDFNILEKAAMKFGATTSFTSIQSAQAMEKMALAGFSTKQILEGMPGVLDLAAASGTDLALVSDIITDNLIPFNMTAKDTGRFADVLAYTMSKTNVDVDMLGESFKYASGGAGALGVSLEETSSVLGLMGDQAIKSGQAGRGLNEVFTNLAKKSGALKGIKIKVTTDKGDFVGIAETVKQFEKKMENMGKVERVAFLNDVLGKQGALSFGKLLTAQKTINGVTYKGAAAVERMIEETTVESVNSASKMRDTMLEGANGTKILFLSAMDGMKIAIGKKMLSENVLKQVQKVTLYISELANVINGTFSDEPVNIFWQEVIGSAKSFINSFKEALAPGLEAIKTIFPSDGNFLQGFIKGLMKLVITATKVVSTLLKVFTPVINFITKILGKIGVDNILIFIGAFMAIGKIITIVATISSVIATVSTLGGILGTIPVILGVIKMAMLALGGPIVWIGALLVAAAFIIYKNLDTVKAFFIGVYEKAKEIFTKFPELFILILGPIGMVIAAGIRIYQNWDVIKAKAVELINALVGIFTGIAESIKGTFTGVTEFFSGIITGITTKFTEIKEMIKLPTPPNWMLKIVGMTETVDPVVKSPDGSHRGGLGYVPYDGYIAELHKGERVLTAEENKGSLLASLSSGASGVSNTVNNTQSSSPTLVFNPVINITGNADTSVIDLLTTKMESMKDEFEKMLKEAIYEKQRKLL